MERSFSIIIIWVNNKTSTLLRVFNPLFIAQMLGFSYLLKLRHPPFGYGQRPRAHSQMEI